MATADAEPSGLAEGALELRALTFGYPERVVGRGASLRMAPGEVFCLLGPNGCGKTTLFRTMLGLLPALGGEVLLDGLNISRLPRGAIARLIAYVPQAQASPFPFTAEEIVLMGRVAHRGAFSRPTTRDHTIARESLEALGVGELAGRDVTRLSGGQRQLVLIARALAQEAKLIVMDEPTASLDFGNQVRVMREIRRLSSSGVGVILSTHDPDHAFALAQRVALMQEGNIVALGAPAHVMTAERLESIYQTPVSIERLSNGQLACAPRY
jgi:iron complex transport system ATP-binding protein